MGLTCQKMFLGGCVRNFLTFTDKDSRVVVCLPESYTKAASVHLSKDEEASWEKVPEVITLMNRTARSLAKMIKLGNSNSDSQRDRITKSVITKDTSPPVVSYLWKTHKSYTDLPPTRPVCNSANGPLARTSNLWTMFLNPLVNMREYPEKCDAIEDMLAAV